MKQYKAPLLKIKVDEPGSIPACFACGTELLARTPLRAGTRTI